MLVKYLFNLICQLSSLFLSKLQWKMLVKSGKFPQKKLGYQPVRIRNESTEFDAFVSVSTFPSRSGAISGRLSTLRLNSRLSLMHSVNKRMP